MPRPIRRLARAMGFSLALSSPAFAQSGSDLCGSATAIGDGVFVGETRAAGVDGAATCAQGQPDVWFLYTASTTGRIVASTAGSNFLAKLSVHNPLTDGCPGGLSDQIACNGNCGGYSACLGFDAVAGSTYLLRLTGSAGNATGDYVLSVAPAPANDSCGGAIPVGEGVFAADNRHATPDGPIAFGPTVWYLYTATFSGRVSIDAVGSSVPSFVSLSSGCPGSPLASAWDCGGSPSGCLSYPVTAGQQLWVSIGGNDGAVGDLELAIQPAGSISGLLSDEATGLPLTSAGSAWVGAYNEFDPHNPSYNPSPVATTTNDATGHYLAQGLRPGTYFLAIEDTAHVPEIYDDLYADGHPTSGTPVTVLSGQTTNLDIDLLAPGQITGTITNALTGAPITAGAEVLSASGVPPYVLAYGSTDASGHYALDVGHLASGVYRVRAKAAGFQTELYHDVACPFDACPPNGGLLVAVTAGATTSGIDFALTPTTASIFGRITYQGAWNQQLEGLRMELFDAAGELATTALSFGCPVNCTPAGTYFLFEHLPPGTYYLRTNFDRTWVLDEVWNNVGCSGAACDPRAGNPIYLAAGQQRTDVHFDLGPGGRLTGVVLGADTGLPIDWAPSVRVYDTAGHEVSDGTPTGTGFWEAGGLAPGDYFAAALSLSVGSGYRDEVFQNLHCPASGCDPLAGTSIHVNANTTVSGIDFLLERGDFGGISGRLTSAAGGTGLGNATIEVFDGAGAPVGELLTSSSGTFTTPVDRILPGTYFLRTRTLPYQPGWIDELYDDLACPGGACSPTTGTPVVVPPNLWATGLQIALDPACTGTLVLGPATVPDGTSGVSYVQQLTASGAVGTPTFALGAGALPPGLTLSPAGHLAGVPLAAGTFPFSVSLTDAAHCFAARTYAPTFVCTLSITPGALPMALDAQAYAEPLSALGGTAPSAFLLSSGALPSGLTLSPTGHITGTPNNGGQNGAFPFEVTATDSLGCAVTQGYVLLVRIPNIFASGFTGASLSEWSAVGP